MYSCMCGEVESLADQGKRWIPNNMHQQGSMARGNKPVTKLFWACQHVGSVGALSRATWLSVYRTGGSRSRGPPNPRHQSGIDFPLQTRPTEE